MTHTNTTALGSATTTRVNVLGPALLAIACGAFLIFMTAFAHPEAVHNAAHDTRHSFAVPCH